MHRVALLCSILGATGASVLHAQPPDDTISDPAYAHPQRMVDVGGGRRLNLYCVGPTDSGRPTVVFESGTSYPSAVWGYVQSAIARRVQACSYDRAGIGFSDPSRRPSTAANVVDDLHALLTAAGIASPYVLVGHSFGGATVRLYADTWPSDVVGMVLVDPAHEDQVARFEAATGGPDREAPARLAAMRRCADAAAGGGLTAGTDAYAHCVRSPGAMFAPEVAHALTEMQTRATYWQASVSELENLLNGVSTDQIRAARRPFGAMPLIILTRGDDPAWKPASLSARDRAWWTMHDELAALSTRSTNRAVPGSGHDIMLERPDAVVTAICDVLAMLRSSRRPN
jgi:pimeloyl-ACP methyl ester carboxylesterase